MELGYWKGENVESCTNRNFTSKSREQKSKDVQISFEKWLQRILESLKNIDKMLKQINDNKDQSESATRTNSTIRASTKRSTIQELESIATINQKLKEKEF